ncbi:MAG: hypothetical protein LBB76_00970 [Azoarcus sp.]|jgi:hypothetical protein|nr:hypothetical protein [Azoarcus sp.]
MNSSEFLALPVIRFFLAFGGTMLLALPVYCLYRFLFRPPTRPPAHSPARSRRASSRRLRGVATDASAPPDLSGEAVRDTVGRFLALPLGRFLLAFGSVLLLALPLGYLLPAQPDLTVDTARDLPLYSQPFGAQSPFHPAELSTPDGKLVNWRGVPGALGCGECHLKETVEWATSMHAISDLDLIYDSTVRENTDASVAGVAAHGMEKGRWCESCHNPLGVLTGAVTPASSVQETAAMEEGTSCIVCHGVNRAEPLAGNGALEIDINGIFRYGHPALLAAAPFRHARDMRARREQPLMGNSALCGACHTEIRPTSVNGATPPMNLQDTYDEWRHSPYASQGIQCQDCHMAQDPAGFVAALKRGEKPEKTVSHRFVGNNYLLSNTLLPTELLAVLRAGSPPGMNRLYDRATYKKELGRTHDAVEALLREAAELRVEAPAIDPRSGELLLRVDVTNAGAGHALPTGPLDQRYLWLEVRVKDAAGGTVFHQGHFDERSGAEDPEAVRWFKEVLDIDGQPVRRHILFDAHTLNYTRKPIPPGQTDRVDYRVPLPAEATGPYAVEVRLWYRIALQDILENIQRQDLGNVNVIIPPLLLEEASLSVAERVSLAASRPQ